MRQLSPRSLESLYSLDILLPVLFHPLHGSLVFLVLYLLYIFANGPVYGQLGFEGALFRLRVIQLASGLVQVLVLLVQFVEQLVLLLGRYLNFYFGLRGIFSGALLYFLRHGT